MTEETERDPLELKLLEIVTKQRLFEEDGTLWPTPLLFVMRLCGGTTEQMGVASISRAAEIINFFAPVDCKFHVAANENVEDLKDAIACAALGELH